MDRDGAFRALPVPEISVGFVLMQRLVRGAPELPGRLHALHLPRLPRRRGANPLHCPLPHLCGFGSLSGQLICNVIVHAHRIRLISQAGKKIWRLRLTTDMKISVFVASVRIFI